MKLKEEIVLRYHQTCKRCIRDFIKNIKGGTLCTRFFLTRGLHQSLSQISQMNAGGVEAKYNSNWIYGH